MWSNIASSFRQNMERTCSRLLQILTLVHLLSSIKFLSPSYRNKTRIDTITPDHSPFRNTFLEKYLHQGLDFLSSWNTRSSKLIPNSSKTVYIAWARPLLLKTWFLSKYATQAFPDPVHFSSRPKYQYISQISTIITDVSLQ